MKHARRRHSRLRTRIAGTTGLLTLALGAGVAPATAAEKTDHGPMTTAAALDDAAQAPGQAAALDDMAQDPGQAAALGDVAQPPRRAASLKVAPAPGQLTLPAPTGRHRVGTVDLHLRDSSRMDPWVPGQQRELMVSLWYPATHTSQYPAALLPNSQQVLPGGVTLPTTAGHTGAPVARKDGKLPVLLYSPGGRGNRATGTALVQDLASRGYLVVTIDHTHDTNDVVFPGGRHEVSMLPPGTKSRDLIDVRAADTHFVINQLAEIARGHNPDVEHRPLPHGLTQAVSTKHIGMFGASLGGGSVAAAMQADHRIDAGVNLDGQLFGRSEHQRLDRPYMLFSSEHHNRNTDPSWERLWEHLHGERLDLKLRGSGHNSFVDNQVLFPQAPGAFGITPEVMQQALGTIDPNRSIEVQRTYVAAFFDKHLRHRNSHLLDGTSRHYPEVDFIR
ncbi:lipase [Streptomyces glebosus]|uniref:Lipase n=1 Tax=Streptomyces glebosus TaxID=249580 RepID=A0A640T620_9ACTN|nr:hydrolase [Streptomyces glebosus]GFE18748.1 lipase [Streptomyces glebosus]GHG49818.1 lipase [Streptomyces glebosus]